MLTREITLRNILSFGPDTEPLTLGPLNMLIGPNGSGKSNFLDAVNLLKNAPGEIMNPIRTGGGIQEWLWNGATDEVGARVEVILSRPMGRDLRYAVSIHDMGGRPQIADELVENDRPMAGELDVYFYYRYQNGRPVLNIMDKKRYLRIEDINPGQSILAQRRDPDQFPEVTWTAGYFAGIRLFRDWTFGRSLRKAERTDGPSDFLEPDSSNLGLVINRLRQQPDVKKRLLQALQELYPNIEDFDVRIDSGTAQVVIQEGRFIVPATRLSDGTMRYLSLLAILCHPKPPPLVCIEEPELGLHPDILPTVARLLREASERCQLIVTTHSEVLVDCMTDTPEAVIVCEKRDGATTLNRLSAAELKPWLERYRLGELWTRGDIGGNRW